MIAEFDKRDVKLIALTPDSVDAAKVWSKEITKLATTTKAIPIIADKSRSISLLYDMLDPAEKAKGTVSTVRDIFIIDPERKVRLIFSYPHNVGASVQEVLRVVDSLQTPDSVSTPAGWVPGQQVLVGPDAEADRDMAVQDATAIAKGVVLGTVEGV
ncbi:hypothetical protein CDD83_10837 [Cordyceps sp. RAO-2017]|nr:hypothetical protein CDD83_10837 [Cordyceps sp. RAO-2017]